MIDYKFTLVYTTARPGGFDLLIESLKDQPPEMYELVVVDNYPGRPDRSTIPEYILKSKIPLRAYVTPSIPFGSPNISGMARACNTGAMWSSTDHIVVLNDFCWLPAGWAYQWHQALLQCQANTLISGTASVRRAAQPEILGDISVWSEETPCWWNIGPEIELWKPQLFETFHFYLPIHFFEATNGLDERKSDQAMRESMFAQAQMLGYQYWVESKVRIGMIDCKSWEGSVWNPIQFKKTTPKPEVDIKLISPNPYCFKDLRDTILGKEWTGAIGL